MNGDFRVGLYFGVGMGFGFVLTTALGIFVALMFL